MARRTPIVVINSTNKKGVCGGGIWCRGAGWEGAGGVAGVRGGRHMFKELPRT